MQSRTKDTISAKILADSICATRLTTFELTFPRTVLAELNTHRVFARNSASSRAIPNSTLMDKISTTPFVPFFQKNEKGMQSTADYTEEELESLNDSWLAMLKDTMEKIELIAKEFNPHKQFINRLVEPWMYTTVILTGTEYANFFALRDHPAAEPHIRLLANKMKYLYDRSEPKRLLTNDWHLPLVDVEAHEASAVLIYEDAITHLSKHDEKNGTQLAQSYPRDRFDKFRLQDISAGKCARVSYLTHDGKRNLYEDIRLALQLSTSFPSHFSPFEHQARHASVLDMVWSLDQLTCVGGIPYPKSGEIGMCGPYKGWKQYRKFFDNENIIV